MKRILPIMILFCFSMTVLSFAQESEEKEKFPTIENGVKMPKGDLKMLSTSGNGFSLNTIKESNGTLVLFSCNTCPFVVMWEDRYDDIQQVANRLKIGVAIVNSNEAKREGDDSFDMMTEHALGNNYTAPYLVDEKSKLANAFGAKTTPHVFLFDKDDVLVYQGAIDDNYKDYAAVTEKYLQNAMNFMANGEEIKIAQTDAVGCSIKREK